MLALIIFAWHEATGAFDCHSNSADEGMEMNKAVLVATGHRLYSEVWNDQPPLYTLALSTFLHNEEATIGLLRRVNYVATAVLLLSLCAVGGLFGLSFGELLLAGGFLAASPWFLFCSASTMLEIPALSIGMMGVCFMLSAIASCSIGLASFGGAILGTAAMIKLTSLSALPILAGFAAVRSVSAPKQVLLVVSTSLLAFVLTAAVIWCICTSGASLRYLVFTHFLDYPALDIEASKAYRFHWDWFSSQPYLTIAALGGGIFLACSPRKYGAGILGMWVLTIIILFATHFPWWGYYSVHLSLPMALLAGVGLNAAIERIFCADNRKPTLVVLTMLLGAFSIGCLWEWGEGFATEFKRVRTNGNWRNNAVVKCLRNELPNIPRKSKMLQLVPGPYSVECGLQPLPWYAVMPLKRFWIGELSEDGLLEEVRAKKADVVIAPGTEMIDPRLTEAFHTRYRLACDDSDTSVWIALKEE